MAITDVNLEGAAETDRLCSGDTHYIGAMDVTSKEDVERCIAEIVAKFDRLDHVFNCAGINPTSRALTETTDEYWDKLVDVNLPADRNQLATKALPEFGELRAEIFATIRHLVVAKPTAPGPEYVI